MGKTQSRYAIGGEFELTGLHLGSKAELLKLTHNIPGTWTLSGRAALALVLRHLRNSGIRHIHLPAYLCESILLPVKALGWDYSFYPVGTDLNAHPDPPSGAAVLLIHYFGKVNPAAIALRKEAGRTLSLIEDASQALLSDWSVPPEVPRFVILSPRKFGPAPFGGWCNITAQVDEPTTDIDALAYRSLTARLTRAAYLVDSKAAIDKAVEDFYLDSFRTVENFLNTHPTRTYIPQIALDVIAGLDWNTISRRRRDNWHLLHDMLPRNIEPLINALPDDVTPLGYIIRLGDRDRIRARLAEQRIFCPVHWLLPQDIDIRNFPEATRLSESCLTLPIDQRYGAEDMARLVKALKTALS